ncbi:MAG: DUF1572 family protein [Trueperaceae bacterium]
MPNYLELFELYNKDLHGALRQLKDDEFFRSPGGSANSAAVIVQHLAGNFASRFTDFLTSDGEKPWREREAEFQKPSGGRQEVMAAYEGAWSILHQAVASLAPQDLQATVHIRGKPWLVDEALLRSVAHFAGHVGQLILIGKLFRGADWEYLSIPPGGTQAYNERPDRR